MRAWQTETMRALDRSGVPARAEVSTIAGTDLRTSHEWKKMGKSNRSASVTCVLLSVRDRNGRHYPLRVWMRKRIAKQQPNTKQRKQSKRWSPNPNLVEHCRNAMQLASQIRDTAVIHCRPSHVEMHVQRVHNAGLRGHETAERGENLQCGSPITTAA
jgi:hypothetical protein